MKRLGLIVRKVGAKNDLNQVNSKSPYGSWIVFHLLTLDLIYDCI